ncbi:unnamed protein product [Arctia plantaginis]|uniref:Uncharacterized protein n=1 Tax=Arctia plantaginis TaxID=874455 RepID=A0A8S0Z538_ARCPL|nr:unnamed protein product [Arctia plantaginis]
MNTIVDIQGFQSDANDFIPKEIAIQCTKEVLVILIKPPYPYHELSAVQKNTVDWVEKYRQIFWEGGFVHYRNFRNCIEFLRNKNIYVKGFDKSTWLRDLLEDEYDDDSYCIRGIYNKFYNLEDFGCPSFSKLYEIYKDCNIKKCIYHPRHCAFTNVHYLSKWNADNKVFD